VVTFAALRLRVKTLDLMVSTTAADASLPSWGRSRGAPILLVLVSVSSVASLGFSCTYLFILICFVRGSPHHLVSVRPCVALFIKRGKSLFREKDARSGVAAMNTTKHLWSGSISALV
jgi:hypothetical protein